MKPKRSIKGKAEGHWVRAIEHDRVFNSISLAARAYGVTRAAINNALRSGWKAGGVHWESIDPAALCGRTKTPWAKPHRKK